MKKSVLLSLSAAVIVSASGLDGNVSGKIRTVYVSQNNDAATDTYTSAIGGILNYETAAWNNLTLGVGVYISEKIGFASGKEDTLNYDVLSADNGSFAYVGEGYLDYSANDFTLRVGRQQIDTPFADTDDIRMLPNTFEGAIITYKGEGMTLQGGYITRWAGYDSGDDISQFKKFTDNSSGVAVVGIVNESVETLAFQGWYYNIDELSNAVYADATYAIPFSETMGLELSAQAANFSEKKSSGMDGNVYGIGAAFNVGVLTLGAAYNKASNDEGKTISSGLGGGPYYTSMEEMTIDGLEDAKAYQLRGEMEMSGIGIEGLNFAAAYGVFKSTPANVKITEIDLVAVYKMSDTLSTDVSYAKIEDRNNNFNAGDDAGYSRFLARLNYTF